MDWKVGQTVLLYRTKGAYKGHFEECRVAKVGRTYATLDNGRRFHLDSGRLHEEFSNQAVFASEQHYRDTEAAERAEEERRKAAIAARWEARAAWPVGSVWADTYNEDPVKVAEPRSRLTLVTGNGEIEVWVDEDGQLEVRCEGRLSISPSASNSVQICRRD